MIFHCMHLNFQRLIFAGKLFPIAGYFSDAESLMDEIGMKKKGYRMYYKIMIRYIAPVCMAAILISGFLPAL